MKKSILRRVLAVEANAILDVLTTRQHTNPQAPLSDVLRALTEELGCCPDALARATDWLKLDPNQAIGRLRRSELIQLSKSVQRFWQASTAKSAGAQASQ